MSTKKTEIDKNYADKTAFATRLKQAAEHTGNTTLLARKAGISRPTLSDYLSAKADPPRLKILALAHAADVRVNWLMTGEGAMLEGAPDAEGTIGIPLYNSHLAAGGGAFNDLASAIKQIPFEASLLAGFVGRNGTEGLAMLMVNGDSMYPTIADGATVLIDMKAISIEDSIYAFVLDDMARVKRLRRQVSGNIEVISDNEVLYPREVITPENHTQFRLLGRVRWIGNPT